jgi:hypothetical protein
MSSNMLTVLAPGRLRSVPQPRKRTTHLSRGPITRLDQIKSNRRGDNGGSEPCLKLLATDAKDVTTIGGTRNVPIWKRTAAVIAKPNTQEHSRFWTNSALCPAFRASTPFACWAYQPRSPIGDLCRQLEVNEAPFYRWKKKDAHLGK